MCAFELDWRHIWQTTSLGWEGRKMALATVVKHGGHHRDLMEVHIIDADSHGRMGFWLW
jgi:hypothetical protein